MKQEFKNGDVVVLKNEESIQIKIIDVEYGKNENNMYMLGEYLNGNDFSKTKLFKECEIKLYKAQIEFNIGAVVCHKSNMSIKMVVIEKGMDDYTCRSVREEKIHEYNFKPFELELISSN